MKKKKKSRRPYLPNNWSAIADAPPEMFESMTYEQFASWKIAGWELPSSIACLIRVTDLRTKKTKEFAYQREGAARNKLIRLLNRGDYEITVADSDTVHHLLPEKELNDLYE